MRTSPVKQLALEHGLPHHEVPADGMNNYQPPATFDLGPRSILLTCSFGHLIPDRLLGLFPYQYQRLNIHPSLLPQLRGAAPIQWAIARGLEQSGVSIQSLERGKFDTGRILAQHKCAFPSSTRVPSGRVVGGDGASGFLEIERVMAEKAAALLLDMLRDLPGHVANSWEQDEMQRTFAPKVRAQHSVVDWLTMSATQIVARDRAFSYLYQLNSTLVPPPGSAFPTAQTLFAGVDRVSLDSLSATCMPSHAKLVGAQPGTAVYSPNLDAVLIAAKEQQHTGLVQVTRFKTKGKKEKSAKDWWAAYRDRASPDGTLLFR
ncbi:Formyltransferase [Testicularia cyperi]|uniref:Formyltransferase n=1 Tax=Testicularia cyperi TaxID=1882483 RepID=A0A317XJ54_9BASI|nr:Formyltransferase [Testicularia cyperi]